jgi:hypothetical protein
MQIISNLCYLAESGTFLGSDDDDDHDNDYAGISASQAL